MLMGGMTYEDLPTVRIFKPVLGNFPMKYKLKKEITV